MTVLKNIMISVSLVALTNVGMGWSTDYTTPKSTAALPIVPYNGSKQATVSAPVKFTQKSYLQHPFIQALISTYNTNEGLRSKAKEQYIRAEKVNQATAGWRPNLSASGSLGHRYNDAQASNAYNPKRTTYISPKTAGVTLQQSLYAGGETVAQIEQAEAAAFAGMADFSKTEQDTLLSAATAFLTLWLKDAVFILREKNVALKTATLEQVTARANVGELTLTDVAQAAGEQAAAIAAKISALSEVVTAKATYLRVVGETPPLDLTPPYYLMSYFPIPVNQDGVIQASLKNNPSIQKAIYDAKSSEAGIDLAKSAFKPKVELNVSGQQDVQGSNPDSRGRTAGVTLNLKVPLYQAGVEYSKFREARQSYSQSKIALANVRAQIVENAVQLWGKWDSAKNQIEQTKIQIKAQALTLEGVRQEFMVGEKTTKDVLDAENKLVEAETALVNAEQVYFLATYELLSIMGQMTAKHLDLPVETYPIQAQYEEIRNKWIGLGDPSER